MSLGSWFAAFAFGVTASTALAQPASPRAKRSADPVQSGTRASEISTATPPMTNQRAAEVLARLNALIAGDSPTLAGPATPRGIENLGGGDRGERGRLGARRVAWADYDPTDQSLPTWSLRLKATNQFAVGGAAARPAPQSLAAPQLAPASATRGGELSANAALQSSAANPWSAATRSGAGADAPLSAALTPVANPLLSRSAPADFTTPTAAPASLEGAAYGAAPPASSR
jgi:hypothetical protein